MVQRHCRKNRLFIQNSSVLNSFLGPVQNILRQFLPYYHSKTLLLVYLRAVFDKTEGTKPQECGFYVRAVELSCSNLL
eukprot:SAG31_NODE_1175_length_9536_cov_20.263113_5_plen_78_part_00